EPVSFPLRGCRARLYRRRDHAARHTPQNCLRSRNAQAKAAGNAASQARQSAALTCGRLLARCAFFGSLPAFSSCRAIRLDDVGHLLEVSRKLDKRFPREQVGAFLREPQAIARSLPIDSWIHYAAPPYI